MKLPFTLSPAAHYVTLRYHRHQFHNYSWVQLSFRPTGKEVDAKDSLGHRAELSSDQNLFWQSFLIWNDKQLNKSEQQIEQSGILKEIKQTTETTSLPPKLQDSANQPHHTDLSCSMNAIEIGRWWHQESTASTRNLMTVQETEHANLEINEIHYCKMKRQAARRQCQTHQHQKVRCQGTVKTLLTTWNLNPNTWAEKNLLAENTATKDNSFRNLQQTCAATCNTVLGEKSFCSPLETLLAHYPMSIPGCSWLL
jgi:hypothetical protein